MAWFAWKKILDNQKKEQEKREAAEVQRRLELWQKHRPVLKPDDK